MKRVLAAGVLAGVAVACSANAPEGERAGRAEQAIIHGVASDPSQDAVVLVQRYEGGKPAGASGCTGTLLTPKLVVTARHCVADTDPSAACAPDGTPISGGAVSADAPASAMFVFPGVSRPDLLSGDAAKAARGAEILDDGAKTLCNHDIALILLDRNVPGAKIAPVRLDAKPTVGEDVTAIGWGFTDKDPEPSVRQQRGGVKILEVGPGQSVASNEALIGEATCQGDSGGPLLATTGAVVAVASRGGNGAKANPPDGCIGAENIYTLLSSFKEMVLSAYAKAGQEPWYEGSPNPLLGKLGATCAADADCQSSSCDTQASVCSQDCSAAACPDGYRCADRGGKKLCAKAPQAADSGCNVGGHGTEASWLILLAALLLVRKRA
jgi:hypothetical protein